MNWQMVLWGSAALLLMAAETLVPGAFLLWMGFAASAVFIGVWLFPDMSLLMQVIAFVVLSFVSVGVYLKWFRQRGRKSDQPLLNRRAEQLVGRLVTLEQPIHLGRGRIRVDDTQWDVEGPELEAGATVRIVAVEGMGLRVESA